MRCQGRSRARPLRQSTPHRLAERSRARGVSSVVVGVAAFALLGVDQRLLLSRQLGQPLLIVLPVVVLLPVDVDAIDDGVGAERVMVPDDDVGVLADLERADAVVDAQLLRGVDRDERERFVFGQPAPLDRLRRLGVQVPRQLGVVGVDRRDDAFARHQRGVVRDRVDRFDLVAPPVGEGRRAGAVRGDLLRHLVALEHVLERGDLEAELVGDAEQHQDLVGAIRMRVDEALAFEDLDERLELQVAPRRRRRSRRPSCAGRSPASPSDRPWRA